MNRMGINESTNKITDSVVFADYFLLGVDNWITREGRPPDYVAVVNPLYGQDQIDS